MKQNPSIADFVGELMFVAIAKPEKVNVSVRYIAHVDALEVIVIDKAYFDGHRNPSSWHEHKLMDKTIYLDSSSAFKEVRALHNEVINLMKNEVAA